MNKSYRSELVGVFGNPVDENPTGIVEEAAFTKKGLNYRYLTIKVNKDGLKDAIIGLKAMNMRGINLTIPFKVEGLKYMDELSPAAKIIGAINIIVNNDGKLWGENTDGKGYLMSLNKEDISPKGKHVVILGAGGAARAISTECALNGAQKITIVNVNQSRGQELASMISDSTGVKTEYTCWDKTFNVPEDTDILSNATSVGLFPHIDQKPDINYDTIRSDMIVTDVIFNDPHSLFLKEAEARGSKTINGLGMLVNQAALNFKLWTGEEAPLGLMEDKLRHEFML